MRILGLQKAINGCDRLEKNLEEAAQDTVDAGTEVLMKESQIQVPKKTGQLAKSARYIFRKKSGPRRIKSVKYGYQLPDSSDETVLDYAAAVHEILKASHASPTKAKYVEDPLVQNVPSYKKSGVVAAKKAVRKSFR